jgi:hypothetical protein
MPGLANLGHVQGHTLTDSHPLVDTLGLQGIQNLIQTMGTLGLMLLLADGVLEV